MAQLHPHPLSFLIMWSLVIERKLTEPFYEPEERCAVRLEVEFADPAAAERFEAKLRKLLEGDDMEVAKKPTIQSTIVRTELYAGGAYED